MPPPPSTSITYLQPDYPPGSSFTPWFKLIARDFLFGWWDELLRRKVDGKVVAKNLVGLVDDRVIAMV